MMFSIIDLMTIAPGSILSELLSWLSYLDSENRASTALRGWHRDGG